jgi:hypothetical protein
MTRLGKAISGFMACSCLALAGPVYAATLVVEDDAGHIGLVNTSNGAVSNVHSLTTSGVPGVANGTSVTLTDLAYTSSGALYGNSFNYLYSLSPTVSNGTATWVGPTGTFNTQLNALVGNSTGGLLGASNSSTTIYNVNTSTGALTASSYNSDGHVSAGDLAFVGSTLYESAVCGAFDCLINASLGTIVGDFSLNGQHFDAAFGLAYDGTTLWATSGTSIYMVTTTNADLTFDKSFAGQGLDDANGATALLNATPIPAALPLFAGGLGMMGVFGMRRKRKTPIIAS